MLHRTKPIVVMVVVVVFCLALAAPTFAASPGTGGQPNQSCGSANASSTPGSSTNAPGSAFNPNGVAGTVYAGQQPQNSKNSQSVSQYDVACFQVSQPHP
jgi:hypothetical protein